MTKTKYVFITPSLGAGGLERVAINLANRGGGNREICLITLSPETPFYAIDASVNVIRYPIANSTGSAFIIFLKKLIWLRKALVTIKPNIICCFGERYNPYFILSSLGLSGKIIVLNRASPLSYISGYRKILGACSYAFADLVVFQTETARRIVKKEYGLINTSVIGNPIDLTFPKRNRENIIINIGSFSGYKNQVNLIEIFNDIVKQGIQNWQLHFIGSGVNLELCMERVREYGLTSYVIFHGQAKDVKTLLAKSKIFAFVSRSEGFPNALAEALACGCASIAYDCVAGPADLIDDGKNGFLIPLDNQIVYQQRLLNLMEDNFLREKFSVNSVHKMRKFDSSYIAERFFKEIAI